MGLPRIYEYKADDGTAYWSFHRSPGKVTPPTRLQLKSRLGEHLVNFIARLRREGRLKTDGTVNTNDR
jgi:hypothetical protein